MTLSRVLLVAVAFGFGTLAFATADEPPAKLAPYFKPPEELANDLGNYRSPLKFDDGTDVKTAADWKKRRAEIRKYWHGLMGEWPALIEKPKVELGAKEDRDGVTQYKLKIETAPGRTVDDAYLLVPDGEGAVPRGGGRLLRGEHRRSGRATNGDERLRDSTREARVRRALARRRPETYYPTKEKCKIQPLSFHAYEAANCCTALQQMSERGPEADRRGGPLVRREVGDVRRGAARRVRVRGDVRPRHRVRREARQRELLGAVVPRFRPGIEGAAQAGHSERQEPAHRAVQEADGRRPRPHDLHALMAPRPFFVSGGSEDPPERWKALNHLVAVNKLLGAENRVAMTNRKQHSPDAESNEALCLFFEYALKK